MLCFLIIDDNPDDRKMAGRELRKEFKDLECREIFSREQFAEALDEGGFDLVITDYQLRWGTGLEVLEAVKKRYPEVPVVMFTGTGSEEIAVQAMKTGLADYILKTSRHIKRLPVAVKSVLEKSGYERQVVELETRYRELFDNLPVGVYRSTVEGEILTINQAGLRLLGAADIEQLRDRAVEDLYADPSDRNRFLEEITRDGYITNFRTTLKRLDGRRFHAEIHARLLRKRRHQEAHIEGVIEDVTPLVEVEKEREKLFVTLKTLFEHLHEGVFLLNEEGRVVLANPVAVSCLRILAGTEVGEVIGTIDGLDWKEYLISPDERGFREVSVSDGSEKRVFHVGGRYTEEAEGAEGARGAVFLVREVTEEKKREERIQAQERLASIGHLAAGIAHDFNNILTVIIGYAEIMLKDPALPSQFRHKVDAIFQGGTRAAKLVRQILDFSRKSVSQKKPVEMGAFLREFYRFITRTIPEDITLEMDCPPGEYTVEADATKLQQVLANLVVNAKDALSGGGRIRLGLQTESLECPLSLKTGELSPGRYVVLTVSDTGTGIPSELIPNIFDPFFTTKEVGKGTGLGLAQVYGIVKQHGGDIDLLTEAGKGTTFRIYLPLLVRGGSFMKEKQGEDGLPRGGGERVLVVEDDETVRELLVTILESMGYSAVPAADGVEGLRRFEEESGRIDLVITDMIMPEMGGLELIKRVKERDSSVRIIVLSGYPDMEDGGMIAAEGVDSIIGKPVNVRRFAETVQKVLRER
jgi:PAS domain S-box-containing protein